MPRLTCERRRRSRPVAELKLKGYGGGRLGGLRLGTVAPPSSVQIRPVTPQEKGTRKLWQ